VADKWTRLDGGWSRYLNQRFGTVIDVPLNILRMVEPASENGDGREFQGDDGSRLHVYATYAPDALMIGFEEYKKGVLTNAQNDGLEVTFEKGGKGWLVFSGLKGSQVHYTKVVKGCEAAHELVIEYPAASKRLYDPIVTRLSRTLSCRKRSP
jgi:hypothetical protein